MKEPKISSVVLFASEPLRRWTSAGYLDHPLGARGFKVFHGTVEKFQAWERAQAAEIEAKREAAKETQRQKLQAKKDLLPKAPAGVFPTPQQVWGCRADVHFNLEGRDVTPIALQLD